MGLYDRGRKPSRAESWGELVRRLRWEIREGDALARLAELADESVQTVVTSPPYWGLRDYGTAEWIGGDVDCDHTTGVQVADSKAPGAIVAGVRPGADVSACVACGAVRLDEQLGLERTPADYVAAMVEVFEEVRRVLRSDGTLWLNMGDSYATGAGKVGLDPPPGAYGRQDDRAPAAAGITQPNRMPQDGLKPKDLVGIPWRLAFALQDAGWYLRADIIWAKPNPMPESVRDRPTKAHEYVFLLTKSRRYFYDAEGIAEQSLTGDLRRPYAPGTVDNRGNGHDRGGGELRTVPWTHGTVTRNRRSVWTLTTRPFKEAHFATFPLELPDICIGAGTSDAGACPECLAPTVRQMARKVIQYGPPQSHIAGGDESIGQGWEGTPRAYVQRTTTGWTQGCACELAGELEDVAVPSVVLDPFAGSGTVGLVALRHLCSFIGVELSPEYADLARRRITADAPLLNSATEAR